MRTYAYARVSSTQQHLDRQIEQLTAYGIADRDIITDKITGSTFERPGYLALKNQMLRPGDKLVITELDRLGRDYAQIKAEYRELTETGIEIVILDSPMLSTADKSNLEKTLISNIIFELLAYTAEKERHRIKSRQKQGISSAKAKGVKFGRPQAVKPPNFDAECAIWRRGEQTAAETMRKLNLRHTTFYKLAKGV